MKERRRILAVASSVPRWAGDSMPSYILHLARDLGELGWDVDVLAPHAPGAAYNEVLEGVTTERFRYLWPDSLETLFYEGGALVNLRNNPWNGVKIPALLLCEWFAVARRLIWSRYDIVHSHWILPQGLAVALSAWPLRVPHVMTVHGGDIFALNNRAVVPFKKLALRLADVVTANSVATSAAITQVVPQLSGVRRIPMGATESRNVQPDIVAKLRSMYRRGDGPLLIFVGRIVEEKGIIDLVHAVSSLVPGMPNVTMLAIGDGPDRLKIEALVKNLGLEDRIVFTGWIPSSEMYGYLAAGDTFVGPSKRAPLGWVEGQGITFAEAMLAGLPVIATNCGGIVDLVRSEETGLIVAQGEPQAIATAVERLFNNPSLARRLSENGRALANAEYTRRASAEKFSALFNELLLAST